MTQGSGSTRTHLMVICTFRQLEASKPVDTQRPMWSSAPFPEMSASSDQDREKVSILLSWPEGLVARGHTLLLSAPFVIHRRQVQWRAETTHGRPHPSYPKTIEVPFIIQRWTSPMISGWWWSSTCNHVEDCCRFYLCHLETFKSNDVQDSSLLTRDDQVRWHTETPKGYPYTHLCYSDLWEVR